LSEDTIGVMASQRAVMPYLHLPIQSGSDRILGAMNRGYGRREYLDLVRRLYEEMPHLALSTDIIVGFPGETEDDFGDTLRAVEESRFDQAFTFIYSPRDGTPAASLPGRPSRDVVQDRFDRLVEVVHESAFRKNTSLVGTVQPVLFTGTSRRNDEMLSGRTPGNKIVHVPVSAGVHAEDPTGRIIEVRILTAHTWFLEGSIVGRNT
jgi:tRNA-2-methylthio-N6-dimethylallyladenosine synthase